jgi:hypothetical protein
VPIRLDVEAEIVLPFMDVTQVPNNASAAQILAASAVSARNLTFPEFCSSGSEVQQHRSQTSTTREQCALVTSRRRQGHADKTVSQGIFVWNVNVDRHSELSSVSVHS